MIWNKRSLPLLLIRILCAVFFAGAIMSRVEGVAQAGQKTYNAELEYLKVLHEKKVVADPVLTFALMSEYLNANQHRAGIAFFQTLLEDSSNLAPEGRLSGVSRCSESGLCGPGAAIEAYPLG